MIIFDFFSGTGSSTKAFEDEGHTVYKFELDDSFEATENVDIMSLTAEYLLITYGRPDFIWASPPCTAFSVAAISRNWISGGENPEPRTEQAKQAQELVRHTKNLIKELDPSLGFLIENPRGMLRKLEVVKDLPRHTVTYCQYGDTRMKPTDLWGVVPNWNPRPICKNGDTCHVSAPRGSRTGTQGLGNAKERSKVPYELGKEILNALPL
jgi:hypothetical protein